MKRGVQNQKLTEGEQALNRNKPRVRSKAEHPFGGVKRKFGFRKARYRGLVKNGYHLAAACASCNPVMAKEALLMR